MAKNDGKKPPPGIDLEKKTISFDYIKGNNFRVIHVDGIYGGNAPQPGIVHMDVFNERWPIPKRTASQFTPGKGVGKEIFEERITRDAVVREVEVHLVMNIEVATKMRDWLDDKITKYQKALAKREELSKRKPKVKTKPKGKE